MGSVDDGCFLDAGEGGSGVPVGAAETPLVSKSRGQLACWLCFWEGYWIEGELGNGFSVGDGDWLL